MISPSILQYVTFVASLEMCLLGRGAEVLCALLFHLVGLSNTLLIMQRKWNASFQAFVVEPAGTPWHNEWVKRTSGISTWPGSWWSSAPLLDQGWGLLSQFPPFRYFPIFFSASPKHMLAIEYHFIFFHDVEQIWISMIFKRCKNPVFLLWNLCKRL